MYRAEKTESAYWDRPFFWKRAKKVGEKSCLSYFLRKFCFLLGYCFFRLIVFCQLSNFESNNIYFLSPIFCKKVGLNFFGKRSLNAETSDGGIGPSQHGIIC